jgi:hypothetical protein
MGNAPKSKGTGAERQARYRQLLKALRMDWSEETNPQLLSIVLVGEYSQRFGHSMPREVMESNMSTEDLNKQMEEALAAGKPIQAWAESTTPFSCVIRGEDAWK